MILNLQFKHNKAGRFYRTTPNAAIRRSIDVNKHPDILLMVAGLMPSGLYITTGAINICSSD